MSLHQSGGTCRLHGADKHMKGEGRKSTTTQISSNVFSPHVFSLSVSVSLVTKMHAFRLSTLKHQIVIVGCNSLTISLHMENKTLNKVSKAIMQSSEPFSPYLKNSPRKKTTAVLGSVSAL